MSEKMTLIQGMKKLKIIQKKITDNTARIREYAALPSTMKPHFGTADEQRKQVNGLMQANIDLIKDYIDLKKRVDQTNLETRVTIGSQEFTIAALLVLRRGMGKMMIDTWLALDDKLVERTVATMRNKDNPVYTERYYDEQVKHAGLQKAQTLMDEIELRLETINATTALVEHPASAHTAE